MRVLERRLTRVIRVMFLSRRHWAVVRGQSCWLVRGPERSLAISRERKITQAQQRETQQGRGAGKRSFLIASIFSMTEAAILSWRGCMSGKLLGDLRTEARK